jgi:Subtilase family
MIFHRRGVPVAVLAFLVLATVVCTDSMSPRLLHQEMASVASGDDSAVGCAIVDVSVTTKGHVQLGEASEGLCAGPLQLVVDTVPSHGSRSSGTVSLDISIVNGGARTIMAPAQVELAPELLPASGIVGNSLPAIDCNASSTGSCAHPLTVDATSPHPMWRFDSLLTKTLPRALTAKHRSLGRTVQFALAPGVLSFRLSLRVVGRAIPLMSMQPPDTFPKWIYSDSAYRKGRPASNLLVMVFKPRTSAANRQAVIDSLHAVVVGGSRLASRQGDGFYYVSVPNAPTEVAVRRLAATVRGFSQIEAVGPVIALKRAYLRPRDSTTWRSWSLTRNGYGSEQNWYLESVMAPMAWGCSVGDTTAHVGIADYEFDSTEIWDHVLYGSSTLGLYSTDTALHHGTVVANVLAAKGNDRHGMTGLMWNAGLMLSDVGDTAPATSVVAQKVDSLAMAGARFVNISFNNDDGDSATAQSDFYSNFAPGLRMIPVAQRPLLIIAAGEEEVPVSTTIMAFAKDSFEAIIVGGSNESGAFWYLSNYGPRVDVYAPAVNVYSWVVEGGTKSIGSVEGTSVAAPQVTALAGLLATFDSRLTVDSIRRFIDTVPASMEDSVVEPALSGYSTRNVPIINAYASLLRAGQRKTAPLCGNPVYADTSSAQFPTREFIVRQEGSVVDTINIPIFSGVYGAPHFGKKIFVGGYSDWAIHSLGWTPAGWTDNGVDSVSYDHPQNQWASFRNLPSWANHDGDSSFTNGGEGGVGTIYLNGSLWVTLPIGPYDNVIDLAASQGELGALVRHFDAYGDLLSTPIYMTSFATLSSTVIHTYGGAANGGGPDTSAYGIYFSDDGSTLEVQRSRTDGFFQVELVDLTQPGWDVFYSAPINQWGVGTTIGQQSVALRRALGIGHSSAMRPTPH